MEKRSTKCVDIAADDDKQQITALFTCTATSQFYPFNWYMKDQPVGVLSK